MQFIVIISVIAVTAYGRPEPPYQYNYPNQPVINSYSAPLASVGAISNNSSKVSNGSTLGVDSSVSSSGSVEFTNRSNDSSSISRSASSSFSNIDGDSGYEVPTGETDENGHSQAVAEKTIYVHLPSPEFEEEQHQRAVVLRPPRVHYKIIFIKAPNAANNRAPVIPVLPQNEERTIVYVLVRKPEEQQDIVIPTPEPTEPSKPEVYFIRYKSQIDESGISPEQADISLDDGTKSSSSGTFNGDKIESNEVSTKYGSPETSGPY